MSGANIATSRPMGRALVVGADPAPEAALTALGFTCAHAADPYAAMAELCRRPLAYRAVILSLPTLYPEELALIGAVKRRFAHIELYLTGADGRLAALAEAMRQGADGLLDADGLHPTAVGSDATASRTTAPRVADNPARDPDASPPDNNNPADPAEDHPAPDADAHPKNLPRHASDDYGLGEPILTADELRALLQEQPSTYGADDA